VNIRGYRPGVLKNSQAHVPELVVRAETPESRLRVYLYSRTGYGCSICEIPLCAKDKCWLPHVEQLSSKHLAYNYIKILRNQKLVFLSTGIEFS